jgi:hypothetical protein
MIEDGELTPKGWYEPRAAGLLLRKNGGLSFKSSFAIRRILEQ